MRIDGSSMVVGYSLFSIDISWTQVNRIYCDISRLPRQVMEFQPPLALIVDGA
jgi:hypothetical protein